MRAEVIAIGTELLLGYTLNDDAAHVGRALAGLGISCYRHVTVGDNPQRLAEALRASLREADLVVTCGGLGPTVDDVTLETIAAVTGRRLTPRPGILRKIEARFRRLGIPMPSSNRRQALLPEGAVELPNTIGTAPGFLLKLSSSRKRGSISAFAGMTGERKYLVALPGPPAELIPMLEKQGVPRLRRLAGAGVIRSRTLHVTGRTESEVDAKVRDLLALKGETTVGIYAHPGQVDLRITASGRSEREVKRRISAVERRILARVRGLFYGADDETLEGVVGQLLKKGRKTLAVAESCTGGLVSERITRVSGSSAYFLGGVVSYSNEMKSLGLSVPPLLLRRNGAVSPQIAVAMAEGIRRLAGSDFGLAITGIAGPTGGSKAKPVGLVFIALSTAHGCRAERFLFSGTRGVIKFKASQAALETIRQYCLRSR